MQPDAEQDRILPRAESRPDSGQILGGYRLDTLLASRPGREVWRAQAAGDGEAVILKLLDPAGMEGWKELELFEREARILQQLDCPGIPRCLDYFRVSHGSHDLFVLIEQYISGRSLAELLARQREGDWQPGEALLRTLAAQLLEILSHLHSRNPPLLHRDIKPSNLLLSDLGELWLLDFGAVSDQLKPSGGSTVVGTFGYMAPEQAMGRASAQSDLYAVGATWLHLVTGSGPELWPRRGFELLLDAKLVPAAWLSWLKSLLAVAPKDRFGSASEALLALDRPVVRTVAKARNPRMRIKQNAQGLRIRYKPRMRARSLLLPPAVTILMLWVGLDGLALWGLMLSSGWLIGPFPRKSLHLGPKGLRVGWLRRYPAARLGRVEVLHNPYRSGLRLELRQGGESSHTLVELDLGHEDLEQVKLEISRSLRALQAGSEPEA